MSRKGTKCVGCGEMFHACGSCGLVGAEWDYCRSSCYEKAGKPTHNAAGEEYEGPAFWQPAPMPSRPLGRVMKPADVEKVRNEGAAVAFGLMGMAEAIRGFVWRCIMCECATVGDKCEWCAASRGVESADDRGEAE